MTDMGNRLSKIVTRTGDDGTTGLGDGSRIGKGTARIDAIGEIDELNSHLGLLLCDSLPAGIREPLQAVQHDLFNLGAELSIPGHLVMKQEHVLRLEQWLKESNAGLPPLKEFILPGGSRAAAQTHVCRTVCRRAERSLVRLHSKERISEPARQYLNRLSDWLFVLARVLNLRASKDEEYWERLREDMYR